MKFKTEQESSLLYDALVALIQIEVNKKSLLESGLIYFDKNGFGNYYQFFNKTKAKCDQLYSCLLNYLRDNFKSSPEFVIPTTNTDYDNPISLFETLAKIEDSFESKLNDAINIAFNDKDWKSFHYLLKKFDNINHICCKALAAVKNNQDLTELCERHFWELL